MKPNVLTLGKKRECLITNLYKNVMLVFLQTRRFFPLL